MSLGELLAVVLVHLVQMINKEPKVNIYKDRLVGN